MPYLKTLSVAQQFVFVSMCIIVAIVTGVSFFMIKDSLESKNEQLKIAAIGRSGGVIEKIDRNFYERFGDVQAFAFNKLAQKCIEQNESDPEVQSFMNTMVTYYVLYDLMLICNENGDVLAASNVDKDGKVISTRFLIGKNFAKEAWFQSCMNPKGLEGGAWYSDFIKNDDVSRIYNRSGWGMAFAAPIKNASGKVIGVWYNFADWAEVTGGIRKETEILLNAAIPGSFILVTNANNQIIDGNDEKMFLTTKISERDLISGGSFQYGGKRIDIDKYVVGEKMGAGAYTYKGKAWKAIAFLPRENFNLTYLKKNLSGFLLCMIAVIIVSGYMLFKTSSGISTNIKTLKTNIDSLSRGELVEIGDSNLKNELGEMNKSIKSLVKGMVGTTHFAQNIGAGNLNTEYSVLSDKDALGQSLIRMQESLRKIKVEDSRRSWITEGLAKFGEILRNQSDFSLLANHIISEVAKYVKANQGSIFVVNDKDPNEIQLDLVACYAWNRKKIIEKSIHAEEGLIGQCYLEGEMIYLTQLPKDYITITSGLGEATPSCLLILPLILNSKVYGILELAWFKEIAPHEKEFLIKLSENIAATLSAAKANTQTRQLLEQSQQQAEELRAQEEEMKQNMEELNATQEEMKRKEAEYLRKIKALESKSMIQS